MNLIQITEQQAPTLAPLVADFRVTLLSYLNIKAEPDVKAAEAEMIDFLRTKGYTVLNMIEIRKPYKGEKPATTIRVGDNVFDY